MSCHSIPEMLRFHMAKQCMHALRLVCSRTWIILAVFSGLPSRCTGHYLFSCVVAPVYTIQAMPLRYPVRAVVCNIQPNQYVTGRRSGLMSGTCTARTLQRPSVANHARATAEPRLWTLWPITFQPLASSPINLARFVVVGMALTSPIAGSVARCRWISSLHTTRGKIFPRSRICFTFHWITEYYAVR